MHVCTLPKTKRKEYHLQTYASWTGVSLLDDQLEVGRRKVGFNTDANRNLKLHTRKQDHVEKRRGNRVRNASNVHKKMHARLKGRQISRTLWRRILSRITRLKNVNSTFSFSQSYFLLDRSCTGSTPRPCGTLSDIHHRIHTWIRHIARSVPSS